MNKTTMLSRHPTQPDAGAGAFGAAGSASAAARGEVALAFPLGRDGGSSSASSVIQGGLPPDAALARGSSSGSSPNIGGLGRGGGTGLLLAVGAPGSSPAPTTKVALHLEHRIFLPCADAGTLSL